MTAKRKTPARAKAPAVRSAISSRGAAANDAAMTAPALALIKAEPAPTAIKFGFVPAFVPAPATAAPTRAASPKSERAEGDAAKLAPRPPISGEERHRMIAKVAYGYAERARFGSDPVMDWLAAEREIDSMLGRVAC